MEIEKTTSSTVVQARIICKEDAQIKRLLHYAKWLTGIFSAVTVTVLITVCLLTTYQVGLLQGQWVDQAFSQVLSQKYDQNVQVSQVKMTRWSDIRFGSLKVFSKKGRPLITASSGRIYLKNLHLQKNTTFETQIRLNDVGFFKEYYKDAPNLKRWGFLMRKPIHAKSLRIHVAQNSHKTTVKVLECNSNEMTLNGSMVFDKTGVVKDNILVSLSPLTMLKAIL